ncbi:MAG: BlaI/MecI/CopY family transcriptional regulator [Lachnospiraceae bacterium]|nr:BlaI/MecI/CopY family transcriptional regulator [Lachnospiraceae bacterium]
MKKVLMDKREQRIMQLLWEQENGEALSVADFERLFAGEKISRPTIFKALQSLMEKGYVSVAGLEPAGTVYARKYEPQITREEYAAVVLQKNGIGSASLGSLALAMLGNEKDGKRDENKDAELIRELEEIIERIRKG